ncbi:hypothetical protein PPL_02934 [Heterostelium album PN500]|uniref:Uncharacterized protein n=1 Tax=Heterostelium pallidum (strain ATCC 26659 / Pp 5 / PN500) TaxID=670386 RepID=D3B3G6_HETP5|nr:hypothetical protein PPL_02934 [Heterostelium album PN500]EFA83864.1 hypothetical protein PPL_02934 [Heterostelium album PN500]|eukprot:XP_020435981.1 hypothetical protein PPL_02934 [Heterostelium album PN500]
MIDKLPIHLKKNILSDLVDDIQSSFSHSTWSNRILDFALVNHDLFNTVSNIIKCWFHSEDGYDQTLSTNICYIPNDLQKSKKTTITTANQPYRLVKNENIITLESNLPKPILRSIYPNYRYLVIPYISALSVSIIMFVETNDSSIEGLTIKTLFFDNSISLDNQLLKYYRNNEYNVRSRVIVERIQIDQSIPAFDFAVAFNPKSYSLNHCFLECLQKTKSTSACNNTQSLAIVDDELHPGFFIDLQRFPSLRYLAYAKCFQDLLKSHVIKPTTTATTKDGRSLLRQWEFSITTIKLFFWKGLPGNTLDLLFESYTDYRHLRNIHIMSSAKDQGLSILKFIESIPSLDSFYFAIPFDLAAKLFETFKRIHSIHNSHYPKISALPKFVNLCDYQIDIKFRQHKLYNQNYPIIFESIYDHID